PVPAFSVAFFLPVNADAGLNERRCPMPDTLPARANLAWLSKTAKQQLRAWRAQGRDAKLADAQRVLARRFGFPSWRALKAEIDRLQPPSLTVEPKDSDEVATFLRRVGDGDVEAVGTMLAASPQLVNAIGPHPYWGGRPQAL